jgi:hypothetical protein
MAWLWQNKNILLSGATVRRAFSGGGAIGEGMP